MMNISKMLLAALAVCGLVASSAHASTIQAYDNSGSSTGGAGGNLNIGHEFQVTGSGINVTALGVYDDGGHVLSNSHDVTLFSLGGIQPPTDYTTAIPLTNVTVAAGGSSASDFVYVSLPASLHLSAGYYGIIAYGMNSYGAGGDPYGDHGGVPDGVATPNVIDDTYIPPGLRYDPYAFTGAGTPAFPTGGDGNFHSSASFLYTVPEPGSCVLLALGAVGLLIARRRAR